MSKLQRNIKRPQVQPTEKFLRPRPTMLLIAGEARLALSIQKMLSWVRSLCHRSVFVPLTSFPHSGDKKESHSVGLITFFFVPSKPTPCRLSFFIFFCRGASFARVVRGHLRENTMPDNYWRPWNDLNIRN